MKRLLIVFCLGLMYNVHAETIFKIEINGNTQQGERVEISPDGDGLRLTPQTWHKKEDQPCMLYGYTKLSEDGKTKNITVSFTAKDTGKIQVHFTGGWNKDPKERNYVYINDLTLNGINLFPAQKTDEKNGKIKYNKPPKDFTCVGKGQFVSGVAGAKTISMLVNQDNRIIYKLSAEKGKKYTFQLTVQVVKNNE